MVGRYLERTMLAMSEVHLSGDEMTVLGRYQTERWHTKLGLIDKIDDDLAKAYNSNARIRYYDRMIESVYRDTRTLQNDLGLKVAVYRNGEPQYVPGQHTLEYTPEIIAQDKRRILMKGEKQSKEYQELKTQLIKYWKSISKDMSDEEFNTCTEVQIYQGVAKEYNISDFFSAGQIIENIQESAWWEGDEAADGYLENLDKGVVDELKQAIVAWADKHNLHPDFCNVVDVEPYTYVLQEGDK